MTCRLLEWQDYLNRASNGYFSFLTGEAARPYQIVTYLNTAIYSRAPLYYSLDIAWDPGRPALENKAFWGRNLNVE